MSVSLESQWLQQCCGVQGMLERLQSGQPAGEHIVIPQSCQGLWSCECLLLLFTISTREESNVFCWIFF